MLVDFLGPSGFPLALWIPSEILFLLFLCFRISVTAFTVLHVAYNEDVGDSLGKIFFEHRFIILQFCNPGIEVSSRLGAVLTDFGSGSKMTPSPKICNV